MTRTTRAAFGKAVLLLAITLIAILPTHAGAAPEGQVAIVTTR